MSVERNLVGSSVLVGLADRSRRHLNCSCGSQLSTLSGSAKWIQMIRVNGGEPTLLQARKHAASQTTVRMDLLARLF